MSERTIRRAIVLFGMVGKTEEVNSAWSEYSGHMRQISDGKWKPSQETLEDLALAQSSTSAHRFPQSLNKQAV